MRFEIGTLVLPMGPASSDESICGDTSLLLLRMFLIVSVYVILSFNVYGVNPIRAVQEFVR